MFSYWTYIFWVKQVPCGFNTRFLPFYITCATQYTCWLASQNISKQVFAANTCNCSKSWASSLLRVRASVGVWHRRLRYVVASFLIMSIPWTFENSCEHPLRYVVASFMILRILDFWKLFWASLGLKKFESSSSLTRRYDPSFLPSEVVWNVVHLGFPVYFSITPILPHFLIMFFTIWLLLGTLIIKFKFCFCCCLL